MSAAEYHRKKPELRAVVAEALLRLRRQADLVVIEGAGSPAEINLKQHDIVNMSVAQQADARVLLVGRHRSRRGLRLASSARSSCWNPRSGPAWPPS